MKATLKNYRQSPRKVRLLADLVRGKSISQALTMLAFTDKRATGPIAKLIKSAVANAEKNHGASGKVLVVRDIRVDKGVTIKRSMPKAFGRAAPINKRTSIISVALGEQLQIKDVKVEMKNKQKKMKNKEASKE